MQVRAFWLDRIRCDQGSWALRTGGTCPKQKPATIHVQSGGRKGFTHYAWMGSALLRRALALTFSISFMDSASQGFHV